MINFLAISGDSKQRKKEKKKKTPLCSACSAQGQLRHFARTNINHLAANNLVLTDCFLICMWNKIF